MILQKLLLRYFIVVSLLGSLLFLGELKPALAQLQIQNSSSLVQRVELKQNGKLFVNEQPAKTYRIEAVGDRYVIRYQALKKPQYIYDNLKVTLQLPATVNGSDVTVETLAVHAGQSQQTRLDSQRFEITVDQPQVDALVTLVISVPASSLHLSGWQGFQTMLQTMPFESWLIVASVVPGMVIVIGLVFMLLRLVDILPRSGKGISQMPPAPLPAAMVSVLLGGRVTTREIAMTLIDLAHRGYIHIIYRGDGHFAFSRTKDWHYDKMLMPYEKLFLDELVSDRLITESSKIDQQLDKRLWNENISKAIDSLYGEMIKLGYFAVDPRKSNLTIRSIGSLLFFISITGLLVSILRFDDNRLLLLPWLVSVGSVPLFFRLVTVVPRRTAAGRDQLSKWLAYRRFLTSSNLKELVPTADFIDLYEKHLAYSIALGVEKRWTAQFALVPCRIPGWFFTEKAGIDSYPQLSGLIFKIIEYIGRRFILTRRPTVG